MKPIVTFFLLFLLALPGFARVETISLKRGLPTDIWLTWPEADRLGEPGLIKTFPEYRQSYKGGEFKLVKQAGFDFVRLTIDPAIYLWKPSAEKTTQLNAGVLQAISEIRREGLKVIVDLHSIPRDDPSPGTEQMLKNDRAFADYLSVVGDVGRAIAALPAAEVAFEPMNEPTIDCDYDGVNTQARRWPGMLKKLHEVAREAAPNLTVILSGACWGGADGLAQLNPASIKDANVIWSFHNYEPMIFSHQGASWGSWYEPYVEGVQFPPQKGLREAVLKRAAQRMAAAKLPAKRKRELLQALRGDVADYVKPGRAEELAKRSFTVVESWANKHSIAFSRIMLGEFGAIRGDLSKPLADEDRAHFISLLRSEAEKRGYAWSTWSWSGSFGISRTQESRDFSPVLLKALGLGG